jgi:hypothetical protein
VKRVLNRYTIVLYELVPRIVTAMSALALPMLLIGCESRQSLVHSAKEQTLSESFHHPTLGELYPEDVDWQTDAVTVPFCQFPIAVCLAEGNGDGPSDDAIAGYEWVAAHWKDVLRIIEGQAFRFYEPYAAAITGVPKFDLPTQLWGTEVVQSIRLFSKDDFEVSIRFTWQLPDDPHVVTFYVEGERCLTHSVDG